MQYKNKDNNQAVLRSLWGRNVPSLTSEEVELSVQAWKKIKARRQRDQSLEMNAELD